MSGRPNIFRQPRAARLPRRSSRAQLERENARLREECARLLERAAHYRNFIELSSEGIWCFAFDPPIAIDQEVDAIIQQSLDRGVMIECNDTLARMYGYEHREDLLGATLAEFMSPRKQENIEYIRAFIASGYRLIDGDSYETDRDGMVKSFLNNLTGIVEGGFLLQAWGTQRDVTERKQLEEQLRQAQKMEAVGQIAGGIAHDFNNMLTVITGSLELFADEARREGRLLGPLGDANRAVDQATALTRQLLTFSRRHVVQRGAVDLNELVSDGARMLRRVVRESIVIETRLEKGLPPVLGDRVELDQVLVNLVLNARDAIGERGTIRIETATASDAPDEVTLRVSDTGHGMDAGTLDRIFEPFFTTKSAASGTGLGLSMVYAAITRLGGSVRAESEPGQGTTFHVRLPISPVRARRAADDPEREAPPVARAHVMVVEDEPNVRRLVTRILESAGHEVLQASSPAEAIELAHETQGAIDLLLSDIVMPGGNGLELARTLKRERPGLRVMLMTGYADLPVELERDVIREARIVPKPFTRAHLEREVRTALYGWDPSELTRR